MEIIKHFEGEYYVGFILRESKSSYLCFDLDISTNNIEELRSRYNKIISVFRYPNIINRSPSGGLHLYYFLDQEYEISEIRSIILSNNIEIKKGYIEQFPGKNGLRLFGGKGCALLDRDLKPIASSNYDIENYFVNAWQYSERLNLKVLRKNYHEPEPSIHYSLDVIKAEYLLEFGLQEPSSRNDTLLLLNRYFQGHLNHSKEETENELIEFMETKNDGKSKDWKENPGRVKKQIHAIVESYNDDKYSKKVQLPIDNLSHENKKRIYDLACKISKTGKNIIQKTYDFLLCFFSYFKFKNQNGIAEIPKVILQACRNGSGSRYKQYMDILFELEVIFIAKDYCSTANKCRSYFLSEKYTPLILP